MINYSRTSTRLGFTKNCMVWRVAVSSTDVTEIELFHSVMSGKRTIRINGDERVSEKKLSDKGSIYRFRLRSNDPNTGEEQQVVIGVEIKAVALSFAYEVYVDGRPFDLAKESWIKAEHERRVKDAQMNKLSGAMRRSQISTKPAAAKPKRTQPVDFSDEEEIPIARQPTRRSTRAIYEDDI